MVSNTRHRAKILNLLLCLVLVDKAESTAARTKIQKLQGSFKWGREQFEARPGRDALGEFETRKSEISTTRGLLQRRRQSQSRVQSGCELSSEDVDRFYDASTQQWLVNDDVLEELDNDVQAIVECAYENDTLLFATDQIIKPRRTLVFSQNLTFGSQSEAEEVVGGVVSMPEKVRLTCPDSGQLILSRSSSFTLRNLVVEDCNTTTGVIEMNPDCSNERPTGIVKFHGLIIERNVILERGSIINSSSARCLQLEFEGVSIRRNRCVGPCVVLSSYNIISNIALESNEGSNNNFENSSVFSAAEGSDISAVTVTSKSNKIKSFLLTNSTLRLADSLFTDNRRNVSFTPRDITIGGGVIFSDHSSVSITNTTFERNSAFSGGVVFAWSSNVSISECVFRENDAGEGNGGALYGHYNSSFDVSSSIFSKNHGYRGAGLFSNHTQRADMVNVSVWENNSSWSCAFWIANGNTSIMSCEFGRNTADVGGAALGAISLNLTLRNSSFSGNSASHGGACLFELNCTVRASGLLFNNNTARQYGGGIHFNLDGYMRIRDSVFQNNNAFQEGGAIHAWGKCETDLKRIAFLNNTSGDYGGALQIRSGNFTGSNLRFSRNSVSKYGGAISFYEATTTSISRSHFEDNSADNAGAVHLHFTLSGYIDQCSFVRNFANDEYGGAVHAQASNVNISTSTFRANTAYMGGSLSFLDQCNSTIVDSSFENNVAEYGGGVISIRLACSLVVSNSSFSSNLAKIGACLLVTGYSNVSLSQSEFVRNYASFRGCLYLHNFGRVLVSDSLFSNNIAESGGGAITLFQDCELVMWRSTLVENNGGSFGGGVYVDGSSSLELGNVSFDRNNATSGGAVDLHESSNATISSCNFTSNLATTIGGAIIVGDDSIVSLTNSLFSDNKANIGGGLCIAGNSTALMLFCTFTRNNASITGGGIVVHDSNMFLTSSQLDSNNAGAGGSLYAFNASLEVTNSTIRRSHAQKFGGAIFVSETNATLKTVHLELNQAREIGGGILALLGSRIDATSFNVVSNLAGNMGGGIALSNASSLLCSSCLILNNRAFGGAGLLVTSNNSIPIVAQLRNSRFENNSAEIYGGGIVFAAPLNKSINCSSPNVTCGHIILLNTSFVDNYANQSGAIVLTSDPNRVLVECEYHDVRNQKSLNKTDMNSLDILNPRRLCSSWRRNRVSSKEYGGVIGTYGREVVLSSDPEDGVILAGGPRNGYVLRNVSSGKQLPTISVKVVDGYGMGPALTRPYSFEARISSPDGFFIGTHSTTIVAGFGEFSGLSGFVAPGNYTFEFTFDEEGLETFNMTVMVRECIVGEEPTRDGLTCQECDSANYNFNLRTPSGCKQCPPSANCTGRYIVPDKGHWHKSPCHDTVQECLVEEACTYEDIQEALTNFTHNSTDCNIIETTLDGYNDALCNEGYKGPLCGSCKKSYGLSMRFLCLKCASTFLSLLTIVCVTLYLLGASSLTIRGCLPTTLKPQDYQLTPSQSTSVSESSKRDPEVNVEMVKMMVEGRVPPEYIQQRQRPNTSHRETPSTHRETEHELTRWKTTEIFKIMLNFLQTIAVAATITVQWTKGMLFLFESSEYIGALTTVAVSRPVDCMTSSSSAVTKASWRMLVSLFVPGVVVSILVSVWGYIALKEKRGWTYFWKRFTLSAIAVVYISYLGLTKMAIRAFYCVSVYNSSNPLSNSKEKLWAVDTAIKCYGKDHSGIIAIAVIVLFFVTVCFPLVSAIVLSRNKERHHKRDSFIFETSGFLFRVFKEKLVFWESLVMFRKACLSLIVVFSYPLGGDSQGLSASVLLFFCLYLQLTLRPYRKEFKSLDHLESFSLLVSAMTFNLSLFFANDRCSDLVRTLLAAVLILGNCLFFVFLLFTLFCSAVVHLKVTLERENVPLPEQASWWLVIKTYLKSRSFGGYSVPKGSR